MRSVKGKALRGKIIALILLIGFLLYPSRFTLYPVYAADSTPSADIRAKLEELKKEIASKAAQLKLEINNKLKDKAYVGKIKTKSSNTLTLATKSGPRIVNINQDTAFDTNIKGKKYSQKLISEEDYIAALGDVDELGVLTAREIILLPTPDSELKTSLWGQVISISDKLFILKNRDLKSITVSASDQSSIKVGEFIILTGNLGKNDIFSAGFIHIIPQGGVLKPKKVATSSASLKATTKSAKPTSH